MPKKPPKGRMAPKNKKSGTRIMGLFGIKENRYSKMGGNGEYHIPWKDLDYIPELKLFYYPFRKNKEWALASTIYIIGEREKVCFRSYYGDFQEIKDNLEKYTGIKSSSTYIKESVGYPERFLIVFHHPSTAFMPIDYVPDDDA